MTFIPLTTEEILTAATHLRQHALLEQCETFIRTRHPDATDLTQHIENEGSDDGPTENINAFTVTTPTGDFVYSAQGCLNITTDQRDESEPAIAHYYAIPGNCDEHRELATLTSADTDTDNPTINFASTHAALAAHHPGTLYRKAQ